MKNCLLKHMTNDNRLHKRLKWPKVHGHYMAVFVIPSPLIKGLNLCHIECEFSNLWRGQVQFVYLT